MQIIRFRDFYVDSIGYEVKYYLGDREMSVINRDEIYHYFNGFLKVSIL